MLQAGLPPARGAMACLDCFVADLFTKIGFSANAGKAGFRRACLGSFHSKTIMSADDEGQERASSGMLFPNAASRRHSFPSAATGMRPRLSPRAHKSRPLV